ncbi:hypothetical protein N7510_001472 [Penicillium lagena]|uniref:uncharacterized protein n=1 Tax=Penicillium lagena TaxID=94218 RepID=UPI0025424154|nr:uncharacterized protein N7510_001472 [Penicillium lagena]KAJ5625163.1 hypothetical protein N7510_001472 [Penicillium lagena]
MHAAVGTIIYPPGRSSTSSSRSGTKSNSSANHPRFRLVPHGLGLSQGLCVFSPTDKASGIQLSAPYLHHVWSSDRPFNWGRVG